jgi:DNA-damage-inducible protein D
MKTEIIKSLTSNFESFAHKTDEGVEFWFACDLQALLGYDEWRNFLSVISRAKTACGVSQSQVSDHFVGAGKMV